MEEKKFTPKLLKLNIQHFSEGGEGNAGDGSTGEGATGGTNSDDSQQQQQADTNERQQQQTDPNGQQQGDGNQQRDDNLFTQQDVNNVLARETRKAQEKILKQLGIDDINSAKEGMAKFHEWQESQKTEQQKQSERLQNLEEDTQQKQSTIQELQEENAALRHDVKAESVGDVVALARLRVTEDIAIDEAIKQVVEDYPQFAKTTQQQQDDGDGKQKPQFSTGQHQKKEESETDKWLNAFKI